MLVIASLNLFLGREFENVVFVNRTDPDVHWTQAQTYVALSRATKRCWVTGERREFEIVCSRPEPVRRTVFGVVLGMAALAAMAEAVSYKPSAMIPVADLELLDDVKEPCVKTLAQIIAANNANKPKV